MLCGYKSSKNIKEGTEMKARKVVGLLVVGLVLLAGCSPSTLEQLNEANRRLHAEDYLVLTATPQVVRDNGLVYIVGTLQNTASFTISYVQITFSLFDKSGAQVGSAMDNINNLGPGTVWKFKALIFDPDDVRSVKLTGIDAF